MRLQRLVLRGIIRLVARGVQGRADGDGLIGHQIHGIRAGVELGPGQRVGVGRAEVPVQRRVRHVVGARELGALGRGRAAARDVEVEARHVELRADGGEAETGGCGDGEVQGDDLRVVYWSVSGRQREERK